MCSRDYLRVNSKRYACTHLRFLLVVAAINPSSSLRASTDFECRRPLQRSNSKYPRYILPDSKFKFFISVIIVVVVLLTEPRYTWLTLTGLILSNYTPAACHALVI